MRTRLNPHTTVISDKSLPLNYVKIKTGPGCLSNHWWCSGSVQ